MLQCTSIAFFYLGFPFSIFHFPFFTFHLFIFAVFFVINEIKKEESVATQSDLKNLCSRKSPKGRDMLKIGAIETDRV